MTFSISYLNKHLPENNYIINVLFSIILMFFVYFRENPNAFLYKDIRIIIVYSVPISLWPTLGKENRYFYTRHPNTNGP